MLKEIFIIDILIGKEELKRMKKYLITMHLVVEEENKKFAKEETFMILRDWAAGSRTNGIRCVELSRLKSRSLKSTLQNKNAEI